MVARLFFVLAFALAAGCETTAPRIAQQYSALAPGPVIRGGMLSPGLDAGGQARRPTGPHTLLRGPVAVTAMGPDVYIADAGLGMIVRVEPTMGVLVQLAARTVLPGTRLAADADGSLYVLDPVSRRIQRFARDGRLVTSYAGDATVASLRDLASDPARGRLLAVDSLNRQLVAFRPLGAAFEILPLRSEPRLALASLDAIAVAGDALYAVDARCACLARIAFDGRVLATFGHQHVRQPGRIAADRDGRLFVADGADRSIKVFQGGELVETTALARFGILEATDLAYAQGWLYVADAPGAQVRMLRVQPPAKAQK